MFGWKLSNSLGARSKHLATFSSSCRHFISPKQLSSFTIATSRNRKLQPPNWTRSSKTHGTKLQTRPQHCSFSSSHTMATPPTNLTEAVVAAMKTLFPEELADSAWDNTGLLLGQAPLSSPEPTNESRGTVLLTNDLTAAVVDEAMEEGAKMIICYHPVIFRPLKSLTTKDPMQTLLLRLAAERVSVYCPHTAMDAASGGLNDWLCDILLGGEHQLELSRAVAQPIARPLPEGHQGAGYGRTVTLARPVALPSLLRRLSAGLGDQRYMMVALPAALRDLSGAGAGETITRVAVCAGSGADVLRDSDAQVLVTGEMAHHYALRHTQRGQAVVAVFHSNSERRYLEARLKPMLEVELETTAYGNTRVLVSKADRDPFEVVDVTHLA
ncbi:NGG1p interacting factor 3 [Hypoxylon cercidicola]|nr:NGG1p interacting factor 3 [Hypoxylon cercidicola]